MKTKEESAGRGTKVIPTQELWLQMSVFYSALLCELRNTT